MMAFDYINILLVDDNQIFLTTLAEAFRLYDSTFCILTAENGKRALKIMEGAPVDLVVTDLKMPIMDGFELIGHMKGSYPHIPIIVLSGSFYPELSERLSALGVLRHVPKDLLNIDALVELVRESCFTINGEPSRSNLTV